MATATATRQDRGASLDVPRWLSPLCLVLAVAGIGVATYLTIAHFDQHVQLACSDSGAVDCAAVTTSKESHFLGIPVALLGLLFFVGIPVLLVPAAWRSRSRWIRVGRIAALSLGLVFVFWLLYAEFFRIHKICLYCSAVHVLTFLLFVVVLLGTALTAPYDD